MTKRKYKTANNLLRIKKNKFNYNKMPLIAINCKFKAKSTKLIANRNKFN